MQRPNTMQSSPSPNAIISSINQSNFLCSQAPDPPTTRPQIIPYKDEDVIFQKPMNRSVKPSFKQVVIIQKKHTNVIQTVSPSKDNCVVNGLLDVSYKIQSNNGIPSEKQENYDFKNLVINNYVQDYSNSQDINSYNNNFEKQKFFLSVNDNGLHRSAGHNEVTPPFDAAHDNDTNMTFNREDKNENVKDKVNDSNCSDPVSINDARTISTENRQNNTPNECGNYYLNENKE